MKNQHVIITGASKGIGLCLARLLLARGAIVSNLSRSAGPVGQHFACDMADDPAHGFLAALNANGPPDILVLNAGITMPGLLSELDPQSFRDQMEVNFFAAVEITRVAIKSMQPGSRLVFVASGAAYVGIQGHSAYCASKFALRGFAESMRGELKLKGILVSIAYPPNTDTQMLADECAELSVETRAITTSAKTHSANDVAAKLLRGIDKTRFEIPIGLEMRLLGRFHSVFKPMIFKAMDRMARKA